MAESKKVKLASKLFKRITTAERARKKEEPDWKKFIDWYEGKYYNENELSKNTDYVYINILKSYIGTLVPAVYFKNPKVYIKAKRPEHKHKVRVVEALLNYWMGELNIKKEIQRVLFDWAIIGHGWLKIGYYADVVEVDDTPGEAETETDLIIRREQPFVRRVSPMRMLVDPSATKYEEARWVCEEILMPVDEAERKYPILKKKSSAITTELPESGAPTEPMGKDRWENMDRSSALLKLHQMWHWEWDKKEKENVLTTTLLVRGIEEPLMSEKVVEELEGFPYEFIAWDERMDEFYPDGFTKAIEEPIEEYEKLRSMELNHMKRSARIFVADSEIMTQEIKDGIESGKDGLVIEVETNGQPVDNFIKAIQDPHLNPQIAESIIKLREEMREIGGLDDFIRGNIGSRVTATQAALVSEGTNLRVEWRRGHLSDFIINSLRKLWKIVQQHYDAEDVIPIVGDDGATAYLEFTPADLEGEFAIDIAINSTAPPNKQLETKEALDRYNLLRPDPKVDSRKLIFDLLETMRVPEIDKFVKSPEESEQMSIQEETEILNQGQKALAHPGDDHEMHLQAHGPEAEKHQNTMTQLQQHSEEIQRLPQGPERETQEQQLMGYQQEMQHLQTLAGVWQDHVQQHQKWRDSDMGVIASGGSARPGEPINPNMFNRRDTRAADLLAENQGG